MSLKSYKIWNSFQFFILNFRFSQTLPRKAIPQINCLIQYFRIGLCSFRSISLLDDTSIIPTTRRLAFNFWVVHSTTYQVRKCFVRKAFESVIKMENIYSVVVENVVAETNNFFQALSLLLAAFNVFNLSRPNSQRHHFYLLYRIWVNCRAKFDSNVKPYIKWNLQNKFILKYNL